MTDFFETFKTYSNTDLLVIIDNPKDYQPIAVETAKTIFESRQLTEKDIKIAREELHSLQLEQDAYDKREKHFEDKVKNMTYSVLSSLNPIQVETSNSDKIIKTISIVFTIVSLLQFYEAFGIIGFMFGVDPAYWDFSMLVYLLLLFTVPIATILFFRRKKMGWTLLIIILTYSAVHSFGLCITTLNRSYGYSIFHKLYPQFSLAKHFVTALFRVGILWAICKEEIRTIYSIQKNNMWWTIIFVVIAAILTTQGLFI